MRSAKIDMLLNNLAIQFQKEKDDFIRNDLFEQIYSHYKNKFVRMAFKFRNEDLTQDLAIVLLKAIMTYDDTKATKFNTYFWKAAQNYIGIMIYKSNAAKRAPLLPLVYLDQPMSVDSTGDTIYLYDVIEDLNEIKEHNNFDFYIFLETEIFIRLPVLHIAIIKLYLAGYTMTEIADLLHTNTSTIQNKIRSIRNNKVIYNKFNEYFGRVIQIPKKQSCTPIYSTEWVQKLIEEKNKVN